MQGTGMSLRLNRDCIDTEIRCYFAKLLEVKAPISREVNSQDSYGLLKFVKRVPLGVGPYPKVSLFENCNRIFSDLVILFGVRRLLRELSGQFPFNEYQVALGTGQGIDIEAKEKGISLAGEAFSVARTFFQTKRRSAFKSVLKSGADYKMLLFNSDAVLNPAGYDLSKNQDVYYLVVDVEDSLKKLGLR